MTREAMPTPSADQFQTELGRSLGIFVLGSVIGACHGVFFGWRANGLEGLVMRAVVERAVKTGLGTTIGVFVAKAVAGRADFSAFMGAAVGLVFPAVYDLRIGAVRPSAFLGGAWCGFLSRFELIPGLEREEPDPENSISETPNESGKGQRR